MKLFFFSLLILGVQTANADLGDGLVAAWTFEKNSTPDLHGSAEIIESGRSDFGKALDLDGFDAYATAELSDEIEAALEKAFTIAYWLYVRIGNDHSGVYKGDLVWGPHYTFRVVVTSEKDMMWGTGTAVSENWFWTPNVIGPKEWIHVALTADGHQVTAYVTRDGKATIPQSANRRPNPNESSAPYLLFPDEPLVMGRGVGEPPNPGNNFQGDANKIQYLDGMIDEVMLWDRALSQEEITELGAGARPTLEVDSIGKLATTWGHMKSSTR